MDSDNELDLVEQAERTALEDAQNHVNDDDETQEIERDVNDDGIEEVEAEEAEEDNDTATKKVVKPRNPVKNPKPKLNADTLRGPRGLTALPALFAKQTFKGKGHEEQDLDVLLKTYKYWCYRLYPKMRFEQCIEKIESLGNKKPVMTYVKRIRMGLLDDEPSEDRNPENLSDEETGTATDSTVQEQQQIESIESRFDSLAQRKSQQVDELTEEQQEIIRVNKEKALKLRQERLRRIQEQAEAKLQTSSILPSSLCNDTMDSQDSSIMNKTTQIVKDIHSQEELCIRLEKDSDKLYQKPVEIAESQQASHKADFDDDNDEFSALCSQIPLEGSQSQDLFNSQDQVMTSEAEMKDNNEGVAVDDYLEFLQSGAEDYEAWKLEQSKPTGDNTAISQNEMEIDQLETANNDDDKNCEIVEDTC